MPVVFQSTNKSTPVPVPWNLSTVAGLCFINSISGVLGTASGNFAVLSSCEKLIGDPPGTSFAVLLEMSR